MIVLNNRKTTPFHELETIPTQSRFSTPFFIYFSYIVFRGFILELMMYLTPKPPFL
jgi:hypothetical protein